MIDSANVVKSYVHDQLISPRASSNGSGSRVLLDDLLPALTSPAADSVEAESALYTLEDILGGHCGVACITARALKDLAKTNSTQRKIQTEVKVACML